MLKINIISYFFKDVNNYRIYLLVSQGKNRHIDRRTVTLRIFNLVNYRGILILIIYLVRSLLDESKNGP